MTRRTILALALPSLLAANDDFVVIAKKGNATPLSKTQLKNLFLGLEAVWPTGARIRLLLGPPGDASRIAALKHFAAMTEADFSKNSIRLTFVGKNGSLPATLDSTLVVRQFTQSLAGAIGIVPPSLVDGTVSAVTIE